MITLRGIESSSVVYLITGASGFVGSALKETLTSMESNVISVGKLEPSEFERFIGRLRFQEVAKKRLILCDWQGVYESREDLPLQLQNSKRWVAYSKIAASYGFDRILALGSQAEISANQTHIHPNAPFAPRNGYGKAKMIAYEGIQESVYGSNTIFNWARLFSVFGPNMSKMTLISKIIKHAFEELPIELSEGKQKWNFLYIDDCIMALIKILEGSNKSEIFNVASSTTHTIQWVASYLASKLGAQKLLKFGVIPYTKNEVFDMSPDVTNLLGLGWKEFTSIQVGLNKCIEDYMRPTS